MKTKQLSQGWKEVELKEIIECVENGNRPKGGVGSLKEGIPSIGGEHINKNGGFNFSNIKFISEEFFNSQRRGIIQQGDVLVVKDGATTGRVTFVSTDNFPYKKALVNEHVFILRPNNSAINPKFLFYYLFGKNGQKQILDNFHGSAQGGINTQFVKKVILLLPPLLIQKYIVAILEKAEKVKANGDNTEKLLDEYLKSVFNEMFYNKGFEIKKLDEICETSSGGTPSRAKKEYWENGKISWIKSGDLNKDKIIEVDEFITELGLKNSSAKYIEPNTVLIAMYGATAGKTSISKIKATTNQAVCALVPKNKNLDSLYLLFWLRSKYKYIVSLSFGGGQPNISQQVVRSLKIPLPPLPLQQKFASIVEQVEDMKENVKKTKQNAEELFNSLMTKAFRGEL